MTQLKEQTEQLYNDLWGKVLHNNNKPLLLEVKSGGKFSKVTGSNDHLNEEVSSFFLISYNYTISNLPDVKILLHLVAVVR